MDLNARCVIPVWAIFVSTTIHESGGVSPQRQLQVAAVVGAEHGQQGHRHQIAKRIGVQFQGSIRPPLLHSTWSFPICPSSRTNTSSTEHGPHDMV